MAYTYKGNRTGPDLFDEPQSPYYMKSPYDLQAAEERNALFAYWYGHGYNDEEIAAQTGNQKHVVKTWRNTRNLRSNYEMTRAA